MVQQSYIVMLPLGFKKKEGFGEFTFSLSFQEAWISSDHKSLQYLNKQGDPCLQKAIPFKMNTSIYTVTIV